MRTESLPSLQSFHSIDADAWCKRAVIAVQNLCWVFAFVFTFAFAYFKSIFTVRNEVAKVMFLHLSVILSTGGGLSAPVHAGIHTPLGRHPPEQTATAADGTHPTGMYSCLFWCVFSLTVNGLFIQQRDISFKQYLVYVSHSFRHTTVKADNLLPM